MEENNIITRLKLFMDSLGISNSQFADRAGIPRPSLSQLLTGRNKKVSDVIISQIHSSFPEVSIMWLLFGEGPMINSSAVPSVSLHQSDSPSGEELDFVTDYPQSQKNAKEISLENNCFGGNTAENQNIGVRKEDVISHPIQQKMWKSERKVVSITVYYDDNSYETFQPSKK